MHWNVAPDALPVSARLVRILDRWLNDCNVQLQHYYRTALFHYTKAHCIAPPDTLAEFLKASQE